MFYVSFFWQWYSLKIFPPSVLAVSTFGSPSQLSWPIWQAVCCRSRLENNWREVERWERLKLESWLRTACLQAAASVLGDFLFSWWGRKADMCCIFELCGRSSVWIVQSCLFLVFPHHPETLSISFICVSVYVTPVEKDGWRDSVLEWNTACFV